MTRSVRETWSTSASGMGVTVIAARKGSAAADLSEHAIRKRRKSISMPDSLGRRICRCRSGHLAREFPSWTCVTPVYRSRCCVTSVDARRSVATTRVSAITKGHIVEPSGMRVFGNSLGFNGYASTCIAELRSVAQGEGEMQRDYGKPVARRDIKDGPAIGAAQRRAGVDDARKFTTPMRHAVVPDRAWPHWAFSRRSAWIQSGSTRVVSDGPAGSRCLRTGSVVGASAHSKGAGSAPS